MHTCSCAQPPMRRARMRVHTYTHTHTDTHARTHTCVNAHPQYTVVLEPVLASNANSGAPLLSLEQRAAADLPMFSTTSSIQSGASMDSLGSMQSLDSLDDMQGIGGVRALSTSHIAAVPSLPLPCQLIAWMVCRV
eukprot:scaffold78732_cov20-Tisochrysis_lutea.AAC.7